MSPGGQNLTLIANATGTVMLFENVGASTRLGALTIAGGISGLTLGSGVTSIRANSFTVGGTVPTTLQNTAALTIDTSANSNGSIAFGGTITGTSVGVQALALTAGSAGTVALSGNVGATRLGAFTVGTGTGGFLIGSDVTSIQANSFTVGESVSITLQNSATLTIDTSSSNGNIAFGGTINGVAPNDQDLTLNPGTGSIVLTGAIGSNVALRDITIPNATNVTASAITATSLTQSAGVGTTLFNDALSMSSDISLTGNNFTFDAPVTANNVSIANLGLLTIAAAADMTLSGSFNQSVGFVQTAGDITTNGQDILFGGGVALTGDVTLDTGGMSGAIQFTGAVNEGFNLILNGGSIAFLQAVGGTPLVSLAANAAGTIDIYGNQTVSSGPMLYTGEVVLHGNSITLTDSGMNGIEFSLPSGSSGANAISGNTNLTLSAPSSSILVNGGIDLSGSGGVTGKNLTTTTGTSFSVTEISIFRAAMQLRAWREAV